jgi:glycosyltransferase involved in cell wall biosynthesis
MRIFVGPTEICGIGKGLVKGFVGLGQDAQLIISIKHPFGYGDESNLVIIRLWQLLGKWRISIPRKSYLFKSFAVLSHNFVGFGVLVWAVFRFDAFIFLFGQTCTNTIFELILLRFLKKKIVFINMGSDIRPPYLDGVCILGQSRGVKRIVKLTSQAKRRAVLHERYADFIVAQPSNAHFYQRKFINWFSMGVPQAFDAEPCLPKIIRSNFLILHSPSDPAVKGSRIIREVIQELIDDGMPLELVCLNGVSNEEVLKNLKNCDLVVDQLYADIPMGVLGSEAAHFAKPCIIAGYLAGEVRDYIRLEDMPPTLYVKPDMLRDTIKGLIDNQELLLDLGRRARDFVSINWASDTVANRYLKLLRGEVVSEWWFDPNEITYANGYGASKDEISNTIAMIVKVYGKHALQASDKPRLENALLQLAKLNNPV